ncbi:hypothetical protein DRE_07557 [Drechslerella stenobrocha 248]|uniref:Myb-like domain-containing protein n=1 Tax=Drechslerella stenobrocha 248 TaxID=1043628 RepID=W7HUE4_9PEZI|nr:hypothetical protein DRE_07557 [Drechslerella stenobrocha 248]
MAGSSASDGLAGQGQVRAARGSLGVVGGMARGSAGRGRLATGRSGKRAVVVMAGKRPAEATSSSESSSGGDTDTGTPVRSRVKRVRVDASDDSGGISGSETDSLEDEVEELEQLEEQEDEVEELEEELDTELEDNDRPRRKFYFESSSESSSDEEDEPTALLTMLRQKEAANAARRQQRAAKRAGLAVDEETKKGTRGGARPLVNDPYRELLNEAINDARTRVVYPDCDLPASLIGEVFWAATEKERFFRALPRVGRHNAVALSQAVGTKSAIEVQGYLHLLQTELDKRLEQQHGFRRHVLMMMEDIPAAVEVSEECERALEAEADRTAGYMSKLEEKARDGAASGEVDFVNMEIARGTLVTKADEKSGDWPLIQPWNWVVLAERIFMASQNGKVADRPAVQKRTLEDMCTLITSVTRRLVHISLFQAHSRLRDTSRYRDRPKEVVLRDAAAAIKMLRMPTTSEEYWRHLPRRFQLRVLDDTKGRLEPMSYDEVEEDLKVFEDVKFYRNQDGNDSKSTQKTNEGFESGGGWETEEEEEGHGFESGYSRDGSSDQPSEDSDADGGRAPGKKSKTSRYLDMSVDMLSYLPEPPVQPLRSAQVRDILNELTFIDEDESYLNAVDRLHSLREERKLWKVLGGWQERKTAINAEIKEARGSIPPEPELAAWRRLEKWKRNEWRDSAGQMIPIWEQRYYRRLWERERLIRIKGHERVRYTKQKKGAENDSEEGDGDKDLAEGSVSNLGPSGDDDEGTEEDSIEEGSSEEESASE